MRGLLDTSVVVALSQVAAEQLPDEPLIGAVTLAELSLGPLVASDPAEAARRQLVLQQVEADFEPLPFDASCARAFGLVAASLRASNRKVRPRALDALIAATALAHGLPLFTANPRDVVGIDGLDVREVNPGSDPR
ncbi:MAG: type II toxin-antitoxin system VapC family toxin [Candidatus Nanopelagicales bacterium]|nr:type II toxin-antitoxin system VapC family toxin [Candidatus Nanopelagicales bacterium]